MLALILGILNIATTERELLSVIKRVKGTNLISFAYKLINKNGSLFTKKEN